MKKQNRITAFILALVIMLTSMPIHTLFAQDTNTSPPTESTAETSLEKKLETDTQAETLGETVKEETVVETVKETVQETLKETEKETTSEENLQPMPNNGEEPSLSDPTVLEPGPEPTTVQINRTLGMVTPMALPTGTTRSVELVKTNQDGTANLSGAEFSIYSKGTTGTSTPTFVNSVTSNSTGSAIFSNLSLNTYYVVRETKAPAGYLPTTQEWDVYIDSTGKGYIAKKGKLTTGTGAQERITSTLPVGSIVQGSNGINFGSAITTVNTTNNTFTQIIYVNRDVNGYYPYYIGDVKLDYKIGTTSAITNVTSVQAYQLTEYAAYYSQTYMPTNFSPTLTNTSYYTPYDVNVIGTGASKTITIPTYYDYEYSPYIIKITGTYDEKSPYEISSTLNFSSYRYTNYYGSGTITTTANMDPSTSPSGNTIDVPNTPTTVSITRQNSTGQTLNSGKIDVYEDTNGNGTYDTQDVLVYTLDTADLPDDISGKFKTSVSYFVKEATPPMGYALNTKVYEFKINPTTGVVNWGLDSDITLSKAGTVILTSVVQPAQLIINKVDENNRALTGATFRVTSDTGYSKEISGAALSQFKFDNLIPGNYRIEEVVVPNGFVEPPTYWIFKVEKDDAGVVSITSPDFPMSVETDSSVDMKGDFAETYQSMYSDLVRNEDPEVVDIMRGTTKVGTISKRIIGHDSDNSYKMEIVLKAEPGQTITGGTLTDAMGDHFNISLGTDGLFTRDDYSLTASDGSFYYIEFDGSKYIKGVYGGEPFGTNRILNGSELTYNKSTDQIVATGLKVSDGQSIKLTYGIQFDENMTNEKNTFYWTNKDAKFSGTSNGTTTGTTYLAKPAARPIVNNLLDKAEISVINSKEKATFKFKKVGKENKYNSDGSVTETLIGLQGSQFELFKSDVNDINTATSTKQKEISNYEGIIEFENLQRDYKYDETKYSNTFYWIKEISSPEGYKLNEEMIGPFRINYDGSVEYLGDINAIDTLTYDTNTKLFNVENERDLAKGDLQINKKINDATGTPLAGTEFTLYYIGDQKPDLSKSDDPFWTKSDQSTTVVSDANGIVKFSDITEGFYRLEETKPTDGYIKSDKIYQVQVDSKGITTIVEVTKPESNVIMNRMSTFSLANETMFRTMSTTFSTYQATATATTTSIAIPDIPTTELLGLYPSGINPRKDNSTTPAPYVYTTKPNNTGFTENYINPDYVTGLYQFDGTYKGQPLKDVAGVNKYVIPTGVPGEYEVHLKISGNRVTSKTGVVVVYDNSNSMLQADSTGKTRLQAANDATKSFLTDLLSTTDPNVKAALVTYGSDLFSNYSYETFTNDANTIISKLPTNVPTQRGQEGATVGGGTYTQRAIERAQELLKNSEFENKIIVTITDGVPTFSKVISGIDANGNYTFTSLKTGTGNRFINPYTHTGSTLTNSFVTGLEYDSYWVVDRTKAYDSTADYAKVSTTPKYYYSTTQGKIIPSNYTPGYYPFTYNVNGNYSRVYYQPAGTSYYYNGYYYYYDYYGNYSRENYVEGSYSSLPNNGYGYKLINNHGYATIGQGDLIKDAGTQMYTIGIQINDSTISGTTTPDAKRSEALEVMFGISSSKDSYFDAQNLDSIGSYLDQILAQVEELNPPTVNGGKLVDPMGDMVTLQMDSIKLRDSGEKPIDSEIGSSIIRNYSETGIILDNLNLSKGQEIELTYKVNLKTEAEDPNFEPGKMYDTNGRTTLKPNSNSTTLWELPLPKISGPSVSIDVTKVWQNPDGTVDEKADGSIQIKLQRRLVGQSDSQYVDDPINGPKTITKADAWTSAYENLIPFDSEGNVFEYRILEMTSDGSYSVLYEGNGGNREIINRKVMEYDFVNIPNAIDFVKRDSVSNEALPGVVFQLRKDGAIYKDQYNPDRDYGDIVSDINGQIFFEKLAPGNYELIELRGPAGYKAPVNPVKTFLVGLDGKITQNGVEITGNDAFKTIYNEPTIVPVKIVKVDGDNHGNLLQGAQFKLYKADGVTEVVPGKIYSSDANGIVDFGNLRSGQYYVQEDKAPDGGYQPVPGLLSLVVQADGKINFNGSVEFDNEGQLYHELANYKEKTTEIAVQKLVKNSDGGLDSISGATFDIKNIDGTDVDPQPGKYTNYTNPNDTDFKYGVFTRLKAGQYRIDERLAPLGYMRFEGYYTFEIVEKTDPNTGEVSNDITWIRKHNDANDTTGTLIYENGQISSPDDLINVDGSNEDGINETLAIRVINEPNKLVFEKVDGDTSLPLQNVKFGLYYEVPQYEEEIFYTKDGTEVKVRAVKEGRLPEATDPNNASPVVRTTDADGRITFERLPQRNPDYGMSEVKFYIKELATADGYQLTETILGPYIISENGVIGPDGKVISKVITSNQILNPEPIQIENFIKPDLQITKVDSKDKTITLDGVEFELYKATTSAWETYNPKEQAQATGIKQTTANGGLATFVDLEEGVYWLKETIAPKDYVRNVDLIGPYLVRDGRIYKVEIDAQGKIVEDSKVELTKDTAITGLYKETITNIKAEYPITGGMGTRYFYLLGILLMAIGYYINRKQRNIKSEIN